LALLNGPLVAVVRQLSRAANKHSSTSRSSTSSKPYRLFQKTLKIDPPKTQNASKVYR
jgi:hypothetical protein